MSLKNMPGVNLQIIPHDEQRYDTCGDWFVDENGVWQIRVSKLSNWKYEFLVFIHELVEMAWCMFKGIQEEAVSAFDIQYIGKGEPGDDIRAPYWFGHQMANVVEKIAAHILEVHWDSYDKEVTNL